MKNEMREAAMAEIIDNLEEFFIARVVGYDKGQ